MISPRTLVALIVSITTLLSTSFSTSALEETVSSELFDNMEYRFIGPYRGGRSVAVAGVDGKPQLYYMGTAGGGVWKTTNAGLSWKPISDEHFAVGSIGSIAVAPSDPNVIYVGTGEGPIRGVTTSHGKGIYKSTDAGETWKLVGLDNRGQIPKNTHTPFESRRCLGCGSRQYLGSQRTARYFQNH